MSLKGSLARLQKRGAKFYLALAQHFEQNGLVRESWEAMSRDMEQQALSLQSIPARFWNQLQGAAGALSRSVDECPEPRRLPPSSEVHSINECFERMLEFEEPVTLKVDAPLIRRLRTESRGHALDFYIMVKAHITRLIRLVQPFSGNPSVTQRVLNLLESFEREVQAPEPPPPRPAKRQRRVRATQRVGAARKRVRSARARRRPSRPLGERAKKLARRAKPLVRKLGIRRRRARR